MDYLFENLGDERFQELCNCIVAKEFPNTQSYPVGQPDGGRDSLVYFMNTLQKEFIVFQVKFVRDPNTIPDVHKWLTKTIEGESAKIDKLIPNGAKAFYLLTNVKGTAHSGVGSKDKVNAILEKNIRIPSICWWRDDLSRLIEKDPVFKWSFPEILNGQDILNSILFENINENKEKRQRVIKAYLADQYRIDNEVKFKQVDLQNKLFDLFTDVPLKVKKFNEKNKLLRRTIYSREYYERKIVNKQGSLTIEDREIVGAAGFLLHPKIQTEIERILLEGGPGQGKSTISQYVCQVHRARLLEKKTDLQLLPDKIKNTPIKLPFKIDLRHIAAWVENKNPYHGTLNEGYYESIWKKSLESFLVGHVVYHSQIDDFNSNDLVAITKCSSILFVFDGFDEIADTKIREEVVDFINKGINRISENAKSIQVVITSRPAAFSDTIGFSVELYPHFELTDITSTIAKEYVERWVKACKLDNREGAEIKKLVEEKLKMPHLKDLAKSPMQLAIFISLLRTRGESLPNKRTALYESYVELFFNRESEKNSVIRDHRDLIIDIHQYLAWVLHSEAEQLKNSGSMHIDDLKARLKMYLRKEGHKTDIADSLFHVMEERVCALVSRVQGTYEFEVQPLREYFCAKYLYNTSPYSPAGFERTGTKPERFDAIARNFYWHNVVRFFAGCFDKGELPMLIQKLKELQDDEILKFTNYPRLLTSQILSDWVFTQYPVLLKDVVKIIVDGINVGSILNQESAFNSEPILLPNGCGREEVINECFAQLKKIPRNDYAVELIGIIKNNPFNIKELWETNLPNLNDEALTKWLEYAYMLEIMHKIEHEVLLKILNNGSILQQKRRIQIVINGNRFEELDKNLNIKKIAFNGILDSEIFMHHRKYTENSLLFLTIILHPYLLPGILNSGDLNVPFINFNAHIWLGQNENKQKTLSDFRVEDEIDENINSFAKKISSVINMNISEWKNKIEPWEFFIENFRIQFQDRASIYIFSNIGAGIKSKEEISKEFENLTDVNKSLFKRVRYARLRSGSVKYWDEQITNSEDIGFTLLVFFTWATPKTIIQLLDKVSIILNKFSEDKLLVLIDSLRKSINHSLFNNAQRKALEVNLNDANISDKFKFILSLRFPEGLGRKYIYDNIRSSNNILVDISDAQLDYLIEKYLNNTNDVAILNEIKIAYLGSQKYGQKNYFFNRYYRTTQVEFSIEIARKIMSESQSYPSIISSHAEKFCRVFANKNLKPVGQIAQEGNWFEL